MHGAAAGRRGILLSLLGVALAPAMALAGPAPSLMLANVYRSGLPLDDYWVSEKYDGLRGYWNGRELLTRGGERIVAPPWFTRGWPETPLDGKLWGGRGRFQQTLSTVRQQQPDDAAWRDIRFMVFDLPAHGGTFTERIPALSTAVEAIGQRWVQAVPQHKVSGHAALRHLMETTVRAGGEGLMLHRGASLYAGGRSDDLLKVKPHEDAEARVIAHLPGNGRHKGRMGALLVETPQGKRFRIGSGFTDAQRQDPPAPGTWITYRYRGTNDSGIPRFATFLRIRPEMPS